MAKDKKKDKNVFEYPVQYDQHMIHVPDKRPIPNLDENYPYRDLSRKGRFKRGFTYAVLCKCIAFPLIGLLTGMKIIGRKKVTKDYKELLKNGAISICNHVHMWDAVGVFKAIRPHRIYQPAWPTNLKGPNAALIRGTGGMPVPTGLKGLKKFSETMDEILQEGGWLHFFPEASMWFYYDALRPFKKGAFTMAVKHNKPILPLVINYRPAKGVGKIFRNGNPNFLTLQVLDPQLPDLSLPKAEAVNELLARCRKLMHDASGFTRQISQQDTHRPVEPAEGETAPEKLENAGGEAVSEKPENAGGENVKNSE